MKIIYQDDCYWYAIETDGNENYYLVAATGGFAMTEYTIKLSEEQMSEFKNDNGCLLWLAQDLARNPEKYNLVKIT